jgi:putative ABC transport system permease protein
VGLSVFLVVNTMNTLIGQHIRQIGVMKSIGGSTLQIMSMYLVLVLIFGFLSFLIAAPLASVLGYRVCQFSAGYINFDLQPFRVVSQALWLEILIAFLAPLTSAMVPVWWGVHLSVREAISNYGLGQEGQFGRGFIDRFFEKIRFPSRPMAISLRNTIRRKDRLILTLLALTLGGAIFMAVINLQDSMQVMIQQSEGYQPADVSIRFAQNYRIEKIQNAVMTIPDITRFEGWKTAFGQLASGEKNNQVGITFSAPPPNSTFINPILLSGRWLMPEDQNALVIGYSLIKERPDLKVGDQITIKINGKNIPFYLIGVYKMWATSSSPVVYINSKYLDQITDSTGQISELRFTTTKSDLETEKLVVQNIQDRFKKDSLSISSTQIGVDLHQQNLSQSMVLISFMALMALLISLVGGLGLMGTMGMNVMERTREIGIMRAIGASSREIQAMVIMEGILIGLVSWVLSIVVSIPITLALNYGVGASILNGPLDFCFEVQGLITWLFGVILIAALSCLLPAWNASRFTIRETLAYE